MTIKYCRTCAWLDSESHGCKLKRILVDPDKDFCSKHATSINTCDYCGGPVNVPIVDMDENGNIYLSCERCLHKSGTCAVCVSSQDCAFITDPSPIPKILRKQIKQGNIYLETDVMNPERIEITCKVNCPCWSADFGCGKQIGTCGKHTHKYPGGQTDGR